MAKDNPFAATNIPKTGLFEITKRSPRAYKTLAAPSGSAAGRGIAFMEDVDNPGNALVADGTRPFSGFVTRPIKVGGPDLYDVVMPNRLELPFSDSDDPGGVANMLSLEYADEVVAEGYDATRAEGHLYSGTGGNGGRTITAGTPLKSKCSFTNGQFCVAETGQYAEFLLEEIMTPMVAGNIRARFSRIEGVVV